MVALHYAYHFSASQWIFIIFNSQFQDKKGKEKKVIICWLKIACFSFFFFPVNMIYTLLGVDTGKSNGMPVQVDYTRFRPNLVLSGGEPYAEDRWRNLKIGNNHFTVSSCFFEWEPYRFFTVLSNRIPSFIWFLMLQLSTIISYIFIPLHTEACHHDVHWTECVCLLL